jgi:hypothetical protein
MSNNHNTKFLGITLDNTHTQKTCIDMIIQKLNSPCFAARTVTPLLSQESLKDRNLFLLSLDYDVWNNFLGKLIL